MKNVNGEEINKELYEKKLNEKLNIIDVCLKEENLSSFIYDFLLKEIAEYATMNYLYGSFNALNDRGIK